MGQARDLLRIPAPAGSSLRPLRPSASLRLCGERAQSEWTWCARRRLVLARRGPGPRNSRMLSIRGVTKKFGALTAVDDLTLEVAAGTVHAFLGPNGAGKTTTIRMCTGLLMPDAGTVSVAGHDLVTDRVAAAGALGHGP